jgi:selenocysteine lyase/cysteine desulfurase
MQTGWSKIVSHEKELVKYTAEQLSTVPKIKFYVPLERYFNEDRIGTFTFNLEGYHHALLSAILENEYGIETRAGTICNHRLVRRWFKIDNKTQKEIEEKIKKGDRLASYGIVRVSLAIHNTKKDVDELVSALKSISKDGPKLKYTPLPEEEIYTPN